MPGGGGVAVPPGSGVPAANKPPAPVAVGVNPTPGLGVARGETRVVPADDTVGVFVSCNPMVVGVLVGCVVAVVGVLVGWVVAVVGVLVGCVAAVVGVFVGSEPTVVGVLVDPDAGLVGVLVGCEDVAVGASVGSNDGVTDGRAVGGAAMRAGSIPAFCCSRGALAWNNVGLIVAQTGWGMLRTQKRANRVRYKRARFISIGLGRGESPWGQKAGSVDKLRRRMAMKVTGLGRILNRQGFWI